jgi:transcriptional regulator with XRE-family HTH domain
MKELARLRFLKGFSQRALAKESGVAPATINELENGHRNPNPSTLRKLAAALDVEVADLLGADYPKAEAPTAGQPSFDGELNAERRAAVDRVLDNLADEVFRTVSEGCDSQVAGAAVERIEGARLVIHVLVASTP